jgi:hypothetical protein
MIVRPSWVKEYSTAMAFDFVTRLAINPVDSRLRRVLEFIGPMSSEIKSSTPERPALAKYQSGHR